MLSRTVRDVLRESRATAGATAAQIADLEEEIAVKLRTHPEIVALANATEAAIVDARTQLANATTADQMFGLDDGLPGYEAQWRRANPGLVALLELADNE